MNTQFSFPIPGQIKCLDHTFLSFTLHRVLDTVNSPGTDGGTTMVVS